MEHADVIIEGYSETELSYEMAAMKQKETDKGAEQILTHFLKQIN